MQFMIRLQRTWMLTAALILLAVLLNFNRALLQLNSSIPGTPEQAASALWHVWWPTFATNAPDGLAIHAFQGGPHLANHLRALPLLQSIPFALISGLTGNPILAFNLILIASTIATILLTKLFIQRHGVSEVLAILGSFALVTSAWYASALTSSELIAASLWLLPLALLAWDSWQTRPSIWMALVMVSVLYASVLAGIQNFAWLTCLWLPYAIWSRRTSRRDALTPVERDGILLMMLLFFILFFIFPGPELVRTLQGVEPAYAEAAWSGVSRSLIGTFLRASPVVIGMVVAALLFMLPRGEGLFWLVVGTALLVIGAGIIPDPLSILAGALNIAYQPLYTRTSFLGPSVFALIMFAAMAWNEVWGRPVRRLVRWVAVLGVMALLVLIPLVELRQSDSMTELRPAPIYSEIAREPEDYYVLDYPNGLTNTFDTGSNASQANTAYLSVYAVWHHKRTISGIGPYYSPEFVEQTNTLSFLHPATIPSARFEAAARELETAVNGWRIGYIFVHVDSLSPEEFEATTRLIEASNSVCAPMDIAGDRVKVYRTHWHPFGCERP